MEKKFIQVHNHVILIDSIGYVDFLDSGRAMIFMPGLLPEKQNISVDPAEAVRLKKILDTLTV
jgi:hypothetical protein